MRERPSSLRVQAVRGVTWTGASTISTTLINYSRLLILARLLSPEDFGLIGMALIITNLGLAFSDMGLSHAIIWKQDADSEQLSTLYWANIMAGVSVFGLIVLAGPLVSIFFREPRLTGLITWAALIFPVTATGQQFHVLLRKNLRFRRLATIEIVSASAGALVAVTLAFLGHGVYSFIWGQLATSASGALLLASLGWREWRPRFVFKPGNLDGMISFGLNQMGQRALDIFSVNIDYIMVGRFLGPSALGAYTLAWQLMVEPMSRINPVLTRVAFPIFARKQDDVSALRRGYVELSKMMASIAFPVIVLAGAVAPALVPLVFGPKWNAAISLIEIFVLLGILRSLGSLLSPLILAIGRADVGFKLSLTIATTSTLLFWFAAQKGLHAMAWSEVIVSAFMFLLVLRIANRLVGLSNRSYLREVGKPALFALAAGAVTYAVYSLLAEHPVGNWWLLLIPLGIGLSFYLLLMIVFERRYFSRYVLLFLGKEPGSLPAQAENI